MTTRRTGGRAMMAACLVWSLGLPMCADAAQSGKPAAAAKKTSVAFDGGRAYEHVRQVVAFGPRPPGSAALESTRGYIKKQLADLGISVQEQAFEARTPIGPIRMVNLIARIPGASPDRIVFGGHYDTKLYREFRFVGANDAGSSTAFLLEWARIMKARQNPFTTELVFFDGEESILAEWQDPDNRYGSRHYVESAKRDGSLKSLKALILVDMIGDRDLRIMREANSTRWLTEAIWSAAKRLKQSHIFVDEWTPIEDDHVPFLNAGVPAVDIIDLDYYPHWHTAGDTLDKVAAGSMQIVGNVLMEAMPEIEKRLSGRPSK